MLYGIQTGAWQPVEVLEQLRTWNFQIIRLDYDPNPAHAAEVITMARAAGLEVLFLVKDPTHIARLRDYIDGPLRISGPNEPDLGNSGQMSTRSYRAWIERAAPLCANAGFELWAPVISNLNNRGFTYLKELWKTLAQDAAIGIDVHRYAPFDSARDPQQGATTRAGEIVTLKNIIGTRKWGVSEFGYSTDRLSAEQQAAEWTAEFAFWRSTDATFAIAYQLNRSQADQYGVREADGRWLPAASVLATTTPPEPPQVIPMRDCFKTAIADSIVNFRDGVIDHGFEARPVNAQGSDETCGLVRNADGTWSILSPNGQQWLSIQPDGSRQAREASGAPGPWEKFSRQGNVLTELATDGTRAREAFLVKDLGEAGAAVVRPEHGALRTRGTDFIDEHDQPWQFRGYTLHLLMVRIKKGDDVSSVFEEAHRYGANTLVTIGTHVSAWKKEHGFFLNPRDAGYANLLATTFDQAAAAGLRVAHAALADVQGVSREDQRWIWDLTCEVAKGRWNVLPRIGNEWNANGWYPGDFTLPDLGGCLASRGSSGINNPPWPAYWQWAEWEGPRDPVAKAMGDAGPGMIYLTDGYTDEKTGERIGPFRCPLVCIEPPYFHNTPRDQWGDERWTSPTLAAQLGLNIGANSAGGAFGSSESLEAQPNGPNAAECARQFFRGLKAGFVR